MGKLGGNICEKKEKKIYRLKRSASACGEFNNPQTLLAHPVMHNLFEIKRSRAANKLGSAYVACTFHEKT